MSNNHCDNDDSPQYQYPDPNFHQIPMMQQVQINPHPPDFTYLTPYTSAADLQPLTPGPLYEIHYHYNHNNNNNQLHEESEPHYPIIPLNYGYHPYSLPMMQHPSSHFFHNRFITPFHPPTTMSMIPGGGGSFIFYPCQMPNQQYASHFESNPNTNQQLSEDENVASEKNDEKQEGYIVQEPDSPIPSPNHSAIDLAHETSTPNEAQ